MLCSDHTMDRSDQTADDHWPQRKRPAQSEEESCRDFKTQRSITSELGCGLDILCRLDSNPNGQSLPGDQEKLLSDCRSGEMDGEGHDVVETEGGSDETDQGGLGVLDQEGLVSEPICRQECSAGEDAVDGGFLDNLMQVAEKGMSKISRKLKKTFQKILSLQFCEEEDPHNNIHVPHPDSISGNRWIGLGLNIQKVTRGHQIRVLPKGLAEQAKLKNGDIIVKVNEQDVQNWSFEQLQEFFGNLETFEIQLLVERKDEEETVDGEQGYRKVAITLRLNFEDDQVVMDVEITYKAWSWNFVKETEPHYIFQNDGRSATKYLMYKDGCFCLSAASDLTPCKFKLLMYSPNFNIPRALLNISQNSPVDMDKSTRIGAYNSDLYGSGLDLFSDSRFFFSMKQRGTNKYTFELTSLSKHYLVADSEGKLAVRKFSDIESVTHEGLFEMERSSLIKHDGSKQDKDDGLDKPSNMWGK